MTTLGTFIVYARTLVHATGRLMSLGAVLAGLFMSGCNGCDLTECGCTSGCFDDCTEGCDACNECGGCECECDGCTLLPIPGGYPASERIPHATQVRLSPDGLEFIEDNLGTIAEPFLSEFLGPGTTLDNILAPIPGVQAVLIEGPLSDIITGAAGVCLQSNPTRSISAQASAFAEGYAESPEFTVPEPTAAIVTSDAGFLSEAFSRHVSIQVRDAGGNWVDVCRDNSIFFVGVATVPTCGADLEPNRTYRITTGIGWSPLILPFPFIRADLFLADNNLCKIRASLQSLELSALEDTPDRLRADVAVRVQTANASGEPASLPVRGFGVIPNCSVSLNSELGPTADMLFRAEIAIVEETTGSRAGLGKLEVLSARFLDPGLEVEDMNIGCDGIVGIILDLFRGPIYGTIEQTVEGLVNERDLIAQVAAIPQAALPDPTNGYARTICPPGSVVDPGDVFMDSDGLCYLDSNGNGVRDADENETAPLLLGAEARLDMGEFISSFSPGLRSAVDLLTAVDGEGDASGSGPSLGYTIDLFAGFHAVEPAGCIPDLADPPPFPDVTQASAFRGGNDEHHVSVGLSEEVMNYGAYQLWRSGAMCLDVTGQLDQQLTTAGLLGLLSPSFPALAFPFQSASLGIQVRPQRPPVITLGTGVPGDETMSIPSDPFMSVSLPSLELHIFIWTSERYARVMTITVDLTIDILTLPIHDGVLQFTSGDIEIDAANVAITNTEALTNDPSRLPAAFQQALGQAGTQIPASLPLVDLNALINNPLLPVGLRITDDFIRLVESDAERFLGIFVDMTMPTPAPIIQRAETEVELVRLHVPGDHRPFELATFGDGELPVVEFAMSAAGHEGAEYEYQYRVDGGLWSQWSRSPYEVVSNGLLLFQGRHTVEARARAVGSPASADMTPAEVSFLIDVTEPRVQTVLTAHGTTLRADDIVSGPEALEYRYRAVDADDFSEWRPLGTSEQLIADAVGAYVFEVRDEAGNVGWNQESLRGLPPPTEESGGCGDCSTGGAPSGVPFQGLLALVVLGVLLRRRDA